MKVFFEWAFDLYFNCFDDYAIGAQLKSHNLSDKEGNWGLWVEIHLIVLHIKIGKMPIFDLEDIQDS